MFIQFVGLPGSGKTTISKRLVEKYPQSFRSVEIEHQRISTLLLGSPGFALLHIFHLFPFILRNITEISSVLKLSDRLAPIVTLLSILRAYNKQTEKKTILILDEFIYQRALSIFGYSAQVPSSSFVKLYFKKLDTYEAVPVFIDLPVNIALSRANNRPHGLPRRLSGMSESRQKVVLETQTKIVTMIKKMDDSFIAISGELEQEDIVDQIAEHFLSDLATGSIQGSTENVF